MKKPDIIEYMDLRLYLEDLYSFRKRTEPGFSYEKWAAELSFRSRGYLRDLVVGRKPLHESLLLPLSRSLNLDAPRMDYLTLLMRYSAVPNQELKLSYGRQLMQSWKVQLQQVVITDLADFISDSLIPVLFTYLSFPDSASDLDQIAQYLNADRLRVQNCLRCLIWQRLIDGDLDAHGKVRYKTAQPYFSIPTVNGNSLLKSFHQEGLKQAEQAMERPSSERKCYATFMALDQKQFQEFQEIVTDFNQRILGIFQSPELGEKRIYRVNTQIFPVSS